MVCGFGIWLVFGSASWCVCQILHWRLPRNPTPKVWTSSNPTVTILRTKKQKVSHLIHPRHISRAEVCHCGGLLISALAPRSGTFSYFLLSGLTVGFALIWWLCQTVTKWWTFWTSRSSKAGQELHVWYIYIYMIDYNCVWGWGQLHIYITYLKRGAHWVLQMSFMVFIRSLL